MEALALEDYRGGAEKLLDAAVTTIGDAGLYRLIAEVLLDFKDQPALLALVLVDRHG